MCSLLIPAKVNYASAWANHKAGRSGQNGRSHTATLDTAADELFAVSMLSHGHQCGMSMFYETTTQNFNNYMYYSQMYRIVAHKFAGPERGRLFHRAYASSSLGLPLRSLSGYEQAR